MTALSSPQARRLHPARPVRRRPSINAWARDVVGVVTWSSVLVVVALWVAGGGVRDLTSAAAGLTSAGRLTGLVASNLLLIQVLLMARIPPLERTYGQDELARRHRLVGLASFWLMVTHIALITVGYALEVDLNPFAQLWELVTDYPGMLLATAGTVSLVLVVVTSIRRARKRLRYESWHLLHLYAYLGVGLALPHQLWTGQEFLSSPVATVYWWTLWACAAGAILLWRVGLPLYRSIAHDLRVHAVVDEGPGVVSVWLRGRNLHRLPVAAGQFFVWRFLAGSGWTRGHPYSLSAAPGDDTLRITVKHLGDGSGGLAGLRPGTRVLFEGPFGKLHSGVRTRRGVTLLASGIGITPMRALLEELPQGPGDVTVIHRAHDAGQLALREEVEALAAERGARLFHVLGPRITDRESWLPRSAAHLSDSEALLHLVPHIAETDVYLCGPDPWMAAASAAALDCGVPASRVHSERFSW